MVCSFFAAVALCNALASADLYGPSPVTLPQLISKARAASGDLLPGSYHIVEATVRQGMAGTMDTLESDDAFVTVVHEGPFTSSFGESGGSEWTASDNGFVTVSPRDETVTTNPYAAALESAGTVKNGAKILGVTMDDPQCIVLELRPREGLVERRYYDAKTLLLQRSETQDFRGTSYVRYEDYRRSFGRMIAYHRIEGDSQNADPIDVRIASFEATKTTRSMFAVPKSASPFDLGGSLRMRIPADFTEAGIIVRVTIAGRGLDFLLDSGASETVIDEGVARQLGLHLYGTHREAFGGQYTESETLVDDFALGNVHARHFALAAIPTSNVIENKRIVGLLGSDFFGSARVLVSFKNETVTMEAPDTSAPDGWSKLKINVDDGVPMTTAKFNGIAGHFIFDLGAFETLLYPHYFEQFKPEDEGRKAGEVQTISGKPTAFREFTFSRLDVGDRAFADVRAIVPEGNGIEGLSYDGVLGRTFLCHFDVLFDYANRSVSLSPSPE